MSAQGRGGDPLFGNVGKKEMCFLNAEKKNFIILLNVCNIFQGSKDSDMFYPPSLKFLFYLTMHWSTFGVGVETLINKTKIV